MISNKVLNVFIGCCTTSFLMEVIMTKQSNSANLITFLQFLLVSIHGFVFTTKFGRVKSKIPLRQYVRLVVLFFVSSVANNYVYTLHVPSTLHMIIRSASCPTSMVVSCWYKQRLPKLTNAIGSVLISIGVATAMYGGVTVVEQRKGEFLYWCIGVGILLSTLVIGAFTGLQQELLFAKYGKHPEEMMFYSSALPLPAFLTIYSQMKECASSLYWDVWCLILMNIGSHFHCIHSVHGLATSETSVTVTFVLTLRKFASLIISAIVFKNSITVYHVVGTFLVMLGTCIYFDYFKSRQQTSVTLKDR